MSGVRNGVQALMKKESDLCLYVHCFAHSLNLCVQEVTRKCEILRNRLEFISQSVQLIRFSPKKLNLFESIRKNVTLSESESDLSPSLRPLHCFAHSLNLCVQEVTRKCEILRNRLEFISQLVQLIRFSPKKLNLFESIRKNVTLSESESYLSPSLRPLRPRWTVRHSAINSILKDYQNIMSSLDIIQQGHDEYAAKGRFIDAYGIF